MGEEERRKIRKALRLLLFKQHRKPGIKERELKHSLGKNYLEIIDMLDSILSDLGLEVKKIENGEEKRFFLTLKEAPSLGEAKTSGWRIDDLAGLCAALAFILSRHGKAPFREVEELLRRKFPKWRVSYNLEKYVRMGYLEREKDALRIGWRAKAEIDMKILSML
jgi:hypothetical protein